MADETEPAAPQQPDLIRSVIPLFALVMVVLAVVAEPDGWWRTTLLVAGVGLFFAWSRGWISPPVLTVGVLVPVIVVQLGGQLEPATFLVCLLAIVVTKWAPMGWANGAAVLAMLATPIAIMALQGGYDYGWPNWMIGILLPGAIGWSVHRQEELSSQLERTRRELAQATVMEERRRIARDVHDLVGHGLAAMMVQVTSARHVLTRNTAAADEALETAEDVGRQSMKELRRTVALLRNEDETGLDAPIPGLAQLGDLVDAARDRGLDVDYRADGAHDTVDPAVGLTLHRIAQEALANASRHAPHARTVVRVSVTADAVVLDVDSIGPVPPAIADSDARPHFGLRGMRERAQVVRGEFRAGPTQSGWSVHCRVPREVTR